MENNKQLLRIMICSKTEKGVSRANWFLDIFRSCTSIKIFSMCWLKGISNEKTFATDNKTQTKQIFCSPIIQSTGGRDCFTSASLKLLPYQHKRPKIPRRPTVVESRPRDQDPPIKSSNLGILFHMCNEFWVTRVNMIFWTIVLMCKDLQCCLQS